MVHMELRSTVVMYFGSYDIGYAIPSLYHVCMDFNEGFTHTQERERELDYQYLLLCTLKAAYRVVWPCQILPYFLYVFISLFPIPT